MKENRVENKKQNTNNTNQPQVFSRCTVCQRKLKKGGHVCSICYTQYEKSKSKDSIISYITNDALESISNSRVQFTKQTNKYLGIDYIKVSYGYQYFRDNFFANFDITVILFLVYIIFMQQMMSINPYLGIIPTIIYIAVIILKNYLIKQSIVDKTVEFYDDKIVEKFKGKNKIKTKIIYLDDLVDIRSVNNMFRPITLIFVSAKSKPFENYNICVKGISKDLMPKVSELFLTITDVMNNPKAKDPKYQTYSIKDMLSSMKKTFQEYNKEKDDLYNVEEKTK